jgi:hypothetical protein
MAQPLHLTLAHHREHALVEDVADAVEIALLRGAGNLVLELVADIEMIGDRALAAARDQGAGGHTRLDRLLDAVLHERLVDDRQHFLGHALGGGQESGAVAGDGEHALADHG